MNLSFSQLFSRVKKEQPLIHQITNFVTVNDCANATLAIGASPVMTTSPHEAGDMAKLSGALVLNLGTLDDRTIEAMDMAGKAANSQGIPVILDPVGCGSTPFRTEQALRLLDRISIQVVRGNASEIHRLIGGKAVTRGVDSGTMTLHSSELAEMASKATGSIIVVSGVKDAVSDGKKTVLINNGTPLLTNVTGTGCMATALIGAFSAVTDNYFTSAILGISTMGIAGELAADHLKQDEGMGMFRVRLIDSLSKMNETIWERKVNIDEEISS